MTQTIINIPSAKISESHLLTCNKNLKQNCDYQGSGGAGGGSGVINTGSSTGATASVLTTYNVKSKSPTLSTVNCDQCGHVKCAKVQVDSDGSSTTSSASSFNYKATSSTNKSNDQTGSFVSKCVCTTSTDRVSSTKYSLGQRATNNTVQCKQILKTGNRSLLRNLSGRDARSATSLDGSSSNATTNSSNDQYYCFDKVEMKRIRDRIAQADVFLEAIGNATTIKNYNSSRYVSTIKHINIHFTLILIRLRLITDSEIML